MPTRPRRGPRRRTLAAVAMALVGSVALSGCDFDVYSLPLPGGTDVGDDPMTVSAEFRDVLDLVPQSSVKVNDVSVGSITDIELSGYTATVTMELRDSVELPANAVASIRQTSLLGEKFVSLEAPSTDPSPEMLEDEDEIPLARTGRNPEVEEVLGALSLVLNGGGVEQLRSIAREVNSALAGRETSVKSALRNLDVFVSRLDANKQDIVNAIEKVNGLAVGVRRQQDSIDAALEELPSAVASLNRQRDDLVRMLQGLERLGTVGVRVIKSTKKSTTETLRLLQPTLTQLANSGDALVDSINVSLTFPFVDEVVGRDPQVARNLQSGDYTNLSVRLDLDLNDLPDLPGIPCDILDDALGQAPLPIEQLVDLVELCRDVPGPLQDCLALVQEDPEAAVEVCSALPADVVGVVCDALPTPIPLLCSADGTQPPAEGSPPLGGDDGLVPDLIPGEDDPQGGGLGGGLEGLLGGNRGDADGNGGAQGRGNGGGGMSLPGLSGLGASLTTGLPGLLNRPALGSTDTGRASGPTMGQMMTAYDPALVSLLTPGMVLR